jgi:phosphoribosylaminoimidazole-succinocarboxamide synthase
MKNTTVLQTDFPLPLFGRGKVRDTYDLDDKLLIVASDRISAFDHVLPTGVPKKGQVLTALSAFWFGLMADVAPNHMISTNPEDFPFDWRDWSPEMQEQLPGRSMLVKKAKRIDIECVARGYLAGSGWSEYKKTGMVTGIPLPPGLQESQQLPEPIFTPATKAETGHDENIPFQTMCDIVGRDIAERLRDATLRIYTKASAYARTRGIIIADTKLEFGLLDGGLIVIDEMLTPDSSRFWEVDKYRVGESQVSLDKQYVRDWLNESGWDHEPPAPSLPDDVAVKTGEKYVEAYTRITGKELDEETGTGNRESLTDSKSLWTASIRVTLKPVVNDPPGLAIRDALHNLGYDNVEAVRSGKYLQLRLQANNEDEARRLVDDMCKRLLANPVIEDYSFEVGVQTTDDGR